MNTLRSLRAISGLYHRALSHKSTLCNPGMSWSVTRSVRMASKTCPVNQFQFETQVRPESESVVDVIRPLIKANICTTYVLTELFGQVFTDSKLSCEEVEQLVELFESNAKMPTWIHVFLSLSINNNLRQLGDSLVQNLIDNPDLMARYSLQPHQAFLNYIIYGPEQSEFTKLVVNYLKQADHIDFDRFYNTIALRSSNVGLWKAVNPMDEDKEFKKLDFISSLKLQSLITAPTAEKMSYVLTQIYDPNEKGDADISIIDRRFTDLLNLLRERELRFCHRTVDSIEQWWNLLPIDGQIATRNTSDSSFCSVCGSEIEVTDIEKSEVDLLRQDFFENLKCDTDKMYASTPEYNTYLEFLQKYETKTNKRFDCVVDLMNIIYARGKYQKNERFLLFLPILRKIVKKYDLKRILLVAKVGNSYFDNQLFREIRQDFLNMGVDLSYFVPPISTKDDLFILDAACWSGPHCFIVSGDHFRQHSALISKRKIFMKWLKARRLLVSRTMELYLPPSFVKYEIQGSSDKGWHIPYCDGRFSEDTPFHKQWLCLQRKI